MDIKLLSGILTTFGSVGAAFYLSTPRSHFAHWMHNPLVAPLTNLGGTVCGFYAIYIFVSGFGWGQGLLAWFVVGMLSAFVVGANRGWYPLFLLLSFVAMISGVVLSFVR